MPRPSVWNPYLRLLYQHLAVHGFEVAADTRFSIGWLWRARTRAGFVHFHWPEGVYRYERGPRKLRPLLSWVKVGLFGARLVAARALGYRLVWTIHQVYPHETNSRRLDRVAIRLLAHLSHVLLAHDETTAEHARAELRVPGRRIEIVPHGSYVGVYPAGKERRAVREELGIPRHAFTFLCFGELRAYKGIELVLEAFRSASLREAALVVAGPVKDGLVGAAVEEAAAADPRIRPRLGLIPEDSVAELFGACDAAVVARSDGGTSGSLVLALSLGLPVVSADSPAYYELTRGGKAGWLFRPGDQTSLRAMLEEAAMDPPAAYARGRIGLEIASRLRWPEIAAQTARLLDGARP